MPVLDPAPGFSLILLFFFFFVATASASEDSIGLSITRGSPPESGTSLYPTTQDTGRRLPVVTTAPPLNIPNHHPLYRSPPQHQALLSPHSQPHYLEDSGGPDAHTTLAGSISNSQFAGSQSTVPHDNAPAAFSTPEGDERAKTLDMQSTPVMHTSAPNPYTSTPYPATAAGLRHPERPTITPMAVTTVLEKDAEKPDHMAEREGKLSSTFADVEEETTTTTITTTTIITTMQSPGEKTLFCYRD